MAAAVEPAPVPLVKLLAWPVSEADGPHGGLGAASFARIQGLLGCEAGIPV